MHVGELELPCIATYIICANQRYAPPGIPGADVGEKRGFVIGIFSQGWYLVGIVLIKLELHNVFPFVMLKMSGKG